jgi:hypothetical protein
LKVNDENSRIRIQDPDPNPDPDPLVRGIGPRIRIRIHPKMSWIHNTVYLFGLRLSEMLQGRPGAKGRDTAVEMALDPEEIDFDSETMALKAEAALR